MRTTVAVRRSIFLCHRLFSLTTTTSSADADRPARRVERSVKVTKHGTIRYVRYGFLLVCYGNFFPKTRRF